MVSEVQKYDSNNSRNLGFAFLAPLGSLLFQKIVFNKDMSTESFFMSIIVAVLGLILIFVGRSFLKEENKK